MVKSALCQIGHCACVTRTVRIGDHVAVELPLISQRATTLPHHIEAESRVKRHGSIVGLSCDGRQRGVRRHVDQFKGVPPIVNNAGGRIWIVRTRNPRGCGADSPFGDADFHVVRSGTELFSAPIPTSSLTVTNGSGYTNSLVLGAGEEIDFLVGRGVDGLLAGSAQKIRIKITSTPTSVTNFLNVTNDRIQSVGRSRKTDQSKIVIPTVVTRKNSHFTR